MPYFGSSARFQPAFTCALRWSLWVACCSFCVLFAACDHVVSLIEPGASDSTMVEEPGVVERATLMVTVTVQGEAEALADLIGSSGGVLSDAEVTMERQGSTDGPRSATTDASGRVQFEELLAGDYAVSVIRVLTEEETALFPAEDSDVNAFGGGGAAAVSAPEVEVEIEATAGRRGSLVISEVSFMQPPFEDIGHGYPLSHYIEVYNNSDTTIQLAGKVILKGIVWVRDFQNELGCEEMEQWRLDPEGIWTRWIYAFPSSGNVRLSPGEAVFVATDAIDHKTEIHENLLDLSAADFEFIGASDVDNPSVPNMVTVGDPWDNQIWGHGLYWTPINEILAVADPIHISELPTDLLPVNSPLFWRVPKDKILDVLTFSAVPEVEAILTEPCEHMVHPTFDRQFAPMIDIDGPNTVQRRTFSTLPDGRKILLRTKTSSRDLTLRSPTPGFIPD